MDVELCYYNNFIPRLGIADTVITLPLSIQYKEKRVNI